MHSDCNFSERYCYDCPYRYCHHEDDMYMKLVNQTKYQIKNGLYWISIDFEYNDEVALRAFEQYEKWLEDQGFEGTTSSYKTWIAYRSDKTPAVDYGYHNGTFYFHKLEIKDKGQGMSITEIVNIIHEQGVEDEVFELLTQWMIKDRCNKTVKIRENEATIRAINKIATQNKSLKQAIDGIISLSSSED